jgi:subtilisin family serine protease
VGVQRARSFRNNLVGVPGVMHVAALASTARRSHYSNYGPGLAVIAPSSNRHTYRRLQLRGRPIVTASGIEPLVDPDFGGTSSATPLVAGIAALVISADPSLSAVEVASLLKRTASKDLDATPYPRTPPATYDPDTGWDVSPVAPLDRGDFEDLGLPEGSWSPWFGHGKVDAAAAVEAALAGRAGVAAPTARIAAAGAAAREVERKGPRKARKGRAA